MNLILYGVRGNMGVLLWNDNCKYNVIIFISEHAFWWARVELKVQKEEIMG
jgi:hypothetical protein